LNIKAVADEAAVIGRKGSYKQSTSMYWDG